ncbi:hypothetical protein [Haloferula sp. A504]|uniref:hypothetical protein n=1 Tax=Haloferula sp. A504 TaxID=3373601 RepID=UPI0031C990B5|nr:hypothetical protein [Verrucomicrobiaceae bacterium E54]
MEYAEMKVARPAGRKQELPGRRDDDKAAREVGNRFKIPKDSFKLVIVRDPTGAELTGSDGLSRQVDAPSRNGDDVRKEGA